MLFSVIVPARNAASSLSVALQSVIEQTYGAFEIIVIDDGSIDQTAAIAQDFAIRESRLRLHRIAHNGVSTARNQGLRLAAGKWVAFLDADDWIAPTYLERLAEKAQADAKLRVIYCDWAYVTTEGDKWRVPYGLSEVDDFFRLLARYCPFSMNSCVVRTELALEVGGFDPTIPLGEDWDFWLRIARTERRFGYVPELLAYYRISGESASLDGIRALRHNVRVLRRAYRPDPRVRHPIPQYARGMSKRQLPTALLALAVWMAGLVIGRKGDPREIAAGLRRQAEDSVDVDGITWALLLSIARARGACLKDWTTFYAEVLPIVREFLVELERALESPGLSRRVITALEDQIIEQSKPSPSGLLVHTHHLMISVENEIPNLTFGPATERVALTVEYSGRKLGVLTLPVSDRALPSTVIIDAIAATYAWDLFLAFAKLHVYDSFEVRRNRHGVSVWRGDLRLATGIRTDPENLWDFIHQRIGWTVFLQELWGRPEWPAAAFYDGTTHADEADGLEEVDLEAGIEVTARLRGFSVTESEITLPVSVAGVKLGLVRFKPTAGLITAGTIRSAITATIGSHLLCVVASEALVGRSYAREPKPLLRHRLHDRLEIARSYCSVNRRCTVIGRKNPFLYWGGDLRRVQFPKSAQDPLLRAALIAGRPSASFNIRKRGDPELTYAPQFFSKPLRLPIDKPTRTERASGSRGAGAKMVSSVPILAYLGTLPPTHRARRSGSVTIAQFASHVKLLLELGCHTLSLSHWAQCMATREEVLAGAVIITFDGLDQRFAQNFWPTLVRAGFCATLFLPTNSIGGRQGRGVRTRISKATLRHMRAQGLEIGTMGTDGQLLTGMSAHEIACDAAESLYVLHDKSAQQFPALAYPSGETNQVVQYLAGGAGYSMGLTLDGRRCTFGDNPMSLPRHRIMRDMSDKHFAKLARP